MEAVEKRNVRFTPMLLVNNADNLYVTGMDSYPHQISE